MKKIRYFLFILVCYIMMCGFVHENVYLTINDDNSVLFSFETLVSNKLEFDTLEYFSDVSIINEGYTKENINQDGYSGVKFYKKFDINELSNRMSSDAPISIEECLSDGIDETKLFSKNENFLNNSYEAEYKFSVYDLVRNVKKSIVDNSLNEAGNSENVESLLNDLESEFSFRFVVSLPYEVSESNAENVSSDKKILTWEITDINYTKNIKFSFELENKNNHLLLYIGVGIGTLVIIVLIILFVIAINKHKIKKQDSVPIHTDYDPSIEELVKEENKLEIVEVDQTPKVAEVSNNVRSEGTEIKLQEEQTVLSNQPIEKKRMFIDEADFKEKLQIDENILKDEVYVEVPEVDDKL